MKLALVLAVFLGLVPSVAAADVINPPGGPVEVDDAVNADTDAAPMLANNGPRGQRQRGQRQRDPRVAANRQRLRASLLAEFDVNGDGKLGPRERVRAVRMLRKIERKLASGAPKGAAGGQRDRQWNRFMNRYDRNRDGQVGPREVPRGAADRLRRFDNNGDGWVERNEVP